MLDVIHPQLNKYLHDITPPRDKILQEMERVAKEEDFPIIGPLVGRLIYQLARLIRAKRVMELGSGFGYSAYWFSLALGRQGQIICTDGNEENAKKARDYFKRGKLKSKIDFRVGEALEILGRTSGQFDIIFCDIDKHDYPQAFQKAIPRLRKGGIMITDNTLWSGKILEDSLDKYSKGILKFNNLIYSSRKVFSTVMPIRDGVAICYKL